MNRKEAIRDFCKMQGDIAGRLGLETKCVCDKSTDMEDVGEVPDKVIEEMWRRLTDPCWTPRKKEHVMNESEPRIIVVERKGECPFYQEEAHFCTVMEDTCPDTKNRDCPLRRRDVLVASVVNG